VWEDHLLPLLTCKDAARLGGTCKALRGVVREHFRDVGTIELKALRGALTTFPRARKLTFIRKHFYDKRETWAEGEKEALLEWLCEGGRGSHLQVMMMEDGYHGAANIVNEALQRGALPSLRRVHADLEEEVHRASLSGGFLRGVHELRLAIDCNEYSGVEPQLAALGLVRQLPVLTRLELEVLGQIGDPVPWPPFIPPSLKALRIIVGDYHAARTAELLLPALPGMFEAGGARLDRLEVILPSFFEAMGDGLAHVGQALRGCSPTLKGFLLSNGFNDDLHVCENDDDDDDEYGPVEEVERLRVQWADVLAGVSACRELRVLVLPRIVIEPLFPPGTAFGRLTHLEMSDHERERPPHAGVMGLWEVMASGGLPALAKLKVRFEGQWGGAEEMRRRVAPALEAVAGTLTHLCLDNFDFEIEWSGDEVEVGYELGVAVGKLRRLKDLTLGLSQDGRFYHAFAQGVAASGGNHPLPLLWRVGLFVIVLVNADLLASLLFPSVRVFASSHCSSRTAVLTACALRQAGYKHTCDMCLTGLPEATDPQLLGVLPSLLIAPAFCRVTDRRVIGIPSPLWLLLQKGGWLPLRDDL
jgi:hypothetical protein